MLRSKQRNFLENYRSEFHLYAEKAALVGEFIRSKLENSGIDLHKIETRAKDPESVHLKILRKSYKDPATRLTDKVGARIITYYPTDVDIVVSVLKASMEIDVKKSVDKRRSRGIQEFGYSSVHLIAEIKKNHAKGPKFSKLFGIWFEIQVRSILGHAWAEIEHEVVFKSEVAFDPSVTRRFSAIAGTLEILGNEFISLKEERNTLIEKWKRKYEKGLLQKRSFDAARLLAFLEFSYPTGLSWRDAEKGGTHSPLESKPNVLTH